MKATYLTATIISMMHAMPCGAATSELETLRQRCQQQEQRIVQLEKQLKQLGAQPKEQEKAAGESSAPSEGSPGRTYTVQAGDNVDKIARRSGCSVAALNSLNNLQEKTVIFPGQTLKLPGKSRPVSTEAAARAAEASTPIRESVKTHTIQQGETYTSISRKYKIPVNTLVSLNPEVKATALRPGLKIRLNQPNTDTAERDSTTVAKSEASKPKDTAMVKTENSHPSSAPPAPAKSESAAPRKESPDAEHSHPRTEPTPVAQSEKPKAEHANSAAVSPPQPAAETPPAAATAEAGNKPGRRIRPVKIEVPMTYGEFASKHGTTPDRLNDLNGLDLTQATILAKGSELYVPAQP